MNVILAKLKEHATLANSVLLASVFYFLAIIIIKFPVDFAKHDDKPIIQPPVAPALSVITLPTLQFKLKGIILSQTGNQAVIAKKRR